MKRIYITIVFGLMAVTCFAQEIDAKLSEAKTAYKSGKLDDTRFALQQALQEVDMAIGKEVLKLLPTKVGSLQYTAESDNVMGMGGSLVGMQVSRNFGAADGGNNANIQIMSDSPLLAGINAILALPSFGGMGGDPNQKRIKVDGYKGLLQKNESDGQVSYDIQIPFASSLLTFHCEGIKNENDVMSMLNTIPVSKIADLIK